MRFQAGRAATKPSAAVTGIIDDGCSRKTLDIPDHFPLVATLSRLAGTAAVLAANEHNFSHICIFVQ